ncbi:hypothetical protein BLD48_02270 [Exiguobacterium sp. KRL4]|uniref:hypothetical protein n=1 Tax=Exiguobacterium sp. KRL4 TaxID=1914536 RepID=UPI0008F9503C|nr:hypothetical protein [Exiguobacterium sp. KRL4]OIN68148.1 hypothetical protein BLD48_02270 [Exiguobacterium sp. KRL4]
MNYELITLGTSIFAVLLSIYTFYKTSSTANQANETANNANIISSGALETAINERISNAKKNTRESSYNLINYIQELKERNINSEPNEKLEYLKRFYNACIEEELNAYEDACGKYIDKKVDVHRFKKTFHVEIRQLVENDQYKEKFDSTTSRYKAILKVYSEWENLER